MSAVTYTPASTDANEDAFSGQAYIDPKGYIVFNGQRIDAKYFLKPVQDEILALLSGRVASSAYRQTWTCIAGLNVGDPVYVSANDTATLALATTEATAAVIGYVRYKPSTTTCYIDHFQYKSGLSGLTAGSPVYLTDAGGFSATPGTVPKVVGVAITATEALVHASPIEAGSVGATTTLTENDIIQTRVFL